jgi:hypothetical protein
VSGVRRRLLFAALLAPLVVAALLLANAGGKDELAGPRATSGSRDERAPSAPQLRARAAERIAGAQIRHEAQAARREDPQGEPGPRPRVRRLYERTRAEAQPAARRFFAAFSLYEVGRLDHAVARELRATATPAFAEELLAEPPRVPVGVSRAERGALGRLEFVPGEPDASRRRLVSGELVGVIRRGSRGETIAIGVRRWVGGWRVSRLGR